MKYDFHNIKTAVKAAARGYDAARLYIDAGTVPIKILLLSVPDGKNPAVPAPLNEAIAAASDTLARTGDPQLVDFELDRAMFVCQARVARETGSDFLSGYVALSADAANLRALSRARRMGRGRDLLRFALSDEGTVAPEKLLDAAEDALPSLYRAFVRGGGSGSRGRGNVVRRPTLRRRACGVYSRGEVRDVRRAACGGLSCRARI